MICIHDFAFQSMPVTMKFSPGPIISALQGDAKKVVEDALCVILASGPLYFHPNLL